MRIVLDQVKMYLKVCWVAIAIVAHIIEAVRMLIVPILHLKVILVLSIMNILMFTIVMHHDLV